MKCEAKVTFEQRGEELIVHVDSDSPLARQTVLRAMDEFFEVDAAKYRGQNIKKWMRLLGRG